MSRELFCGCQRDGTHALGVAAPGRLACDRQKGRQKWIAATPPGECLKILMSRMAANRKLKMLYADVSRAYFYAAAVRPVFVKLPDEDSEC